MVTILIVDDDPKLLNMLRRTLSYEGFRVLSAMNGSEALAELRARRFGPPGAGSELAHRSPPDHPEAGQSGGCARRYTARA